jgi:hypothetical protein
MSVTLPILKKGDEVYFHPHWGGPFSVAKCIIRKAETYIDSKGEYNVRYYIRYCKPFEGYSQSPYTFDKSNPYGCNLFLTAEECLAHNVEQYKKNVMLDIESLKKECKRCNIDFNEPIKLIQ